MLEALLNMPPVQLCFAQAQLESNASVVQGRTHVTLLQSNITINPQQSAAAGPMHVLLPITILGDFSNSTKSMNTLNFSFARSVFALPDGAKEGQLQLQHVVLQGLAQGPAAAAANSLTSPDVWTILVWAVDRCAQVFVGLT